MAGRKRAKRGEAQAAAAADPSAAPSSNARVEYSAAAAANVGAAGQQQNAAILERMDRLEAETRTLKAEKENLKGDVKRWEACALCTD